MTPAGKPGLKNLRIAIVESQSRPRGRFITVEGGEGVGKSTNIEVLVSSIEAAGITVVQTREPGGTDLAESIRELLLAPRDEIVDARCELLLMFAARAQHLSQRIVPALERGHWVVCDRFTDATRAYQGGGRGMSLDAINDLARWVHGELNPDATVLLDVDVETGMARALARSEADRFEQEQMAFFEQVRNSYLALAQAEPERFHLIDAGQALERVRVDIEQLGRQLVERWHG